MENHHNLPLFTSTNSKYSNKLKCVCMRLKQYFWGFESETVKWCCIKKEKKARSPQSLQCAADQSDSVLGANVTLPQRHILRSVRATAFLAHTNKTDVAGVGGRCTQAARALINYLNSWELMTSLQACRFAATFSSLWSRLSTSSCWFSSLLLSCYVSPVDRA